MDRYKEHQILEHKETKELWYITYKSDHLSPFDYYVVKPINEVNKEHTLKESNKYYKSRLQINREFNTISIKRTNKIKRVMKVLF